jgi:hypothetical protein
VIVPRRIVRVTAWLVWGAAAEAAAVWGVIKSSSRREGLRERNRSDLEVLARNGGLPFTDDEWVEECSDCEATGMKAGALCPGCEGRCYVPHEHWSTL